MSDTILRFVPSDPFWCPSPEAATNAAGLLKGFAPKAERIEQDFPAEVRFYDPGGNWSGVKCSACGEDAEPWWGEAMSEAAETNFSDLNVTAQCCGAKVSLNDLHYVWPAAFGRFSLEAMNPDVDTTSEEERSIGNALGIAVKKIWVHI